MNSPGNKPTGNFFLTETQRAQRFFDRIDRISDSFASARRNYRIENFYRIERKERREKIVQSMIKILLFRSKKLSGTEGQFFCAWLKWPIEKANIRTLLTNFFPVWLRFMTYFGIVIENTTKGYR